MQNLSTFLRLVWKGLEVTFSLTIKL